MFKTIYSQIQRDKDYPERSYILGIRARVLNGTIYDHLAHGFHEEKNGAGEYIPIRNRRPCVHSNLSKVVVDDSVALVFSEGHFPEIECSSEEVRETLQAVIKETKLNEVMVDAATKGSVGSVAIWFRVLKGRIFFNAKSTEHLTPTWDPEEPDKLLELTEAYKCKGRDLCAVGIRVADKDATYWYRRTWTKTQEIHYHPQTLVAYMEGKDPVIDSSKTKFHGFNFVPFEWVKNLPGGDCDDVDGACTFTAAIETQIEIDYQMSQCGRGLKYSSDPTLLIKEPAVGNDAIIKGAGNALIVAQDGDAKMLEINGTAAAAVIEYCKALREFGLEAIHGNRVSPDKIAAMQSGKAMEMMNQPLINLADKLRTPYGEGALLNLLKMVVVASNKFELIVNGEKTAKMSPREKISLRWPAWYAPTATDLVSMANAVATFIEAGVMSRETGIKAIAAIYDVEDTVAEQKLIEAEIEKKQEHEIKMKEKSAKQDKKEEAPGGVN